MTVTERLQSDIAEAMRSGDREKTTTLRMLLSSLQMAAKESKDKDLDDAGEVAVLRREHKRRLEAAEAFREGGRDDRAEAEQREAEFVKAYMPEELPDEELQQLVDAAVTESGATSPSEVGKVMGLVMPKVQGRADGRRVNALVRERLGA